MMIKTTTIIRSCTLNILSRNKQFIHIQKPIAWLHKCNKLKSNIVISDQSIISNKYLSTSSSSLAEEKKEEKTINNEKRLAHIGYFDIEDRNKKTFLATLDLFKEKEKHLKGYVEFIYASLRHMKEFEVDKELEVYKKLLQILPKGTMITTNVFHSMFMHYPRQQYCAIDVLEQMEKNKVMPDWELDEILLNTFGRDSHPVKKCRRMIYWGRKFKYASPWNLPDPIPADAFALAMLGVKRMCSVDPATKIQVLETKDIEDSIDDTWIVSGQSPDQKEILLKHPNNVPLKVEGPFVLYLKTHRVNYFILRTDFVRPKPPLEDPDDITDLYSFQDEVKIKSLIRPHSVHEQEDGTIFSVCVTGTTSRDSTLSWIRLLEKENPVIKNIPILFEYSSPLGPVLEIDEGHIKENVPQTQE